MTFRLPVYTMNLRKRMVKMPKSLFYDTGLVCWLVGIRDPDQLRVHPLRGSIFETWVVSEIAKHRANSGETGGISFYRDRNGVAADLIAETRYMTVIVDAKSSQTASSSLFDGIRRVRKHLAQNDRNLSLAVVYGGDRPQQQGSDRLIPWNALHECDWNRLDDFGVT